MVLADPFFPLTILVEHWMFPFVDVFLQVTFVMALLFYWLSVFHGMRKVNFLFPD